jgi:EAL domain-containing protein (putative c-di-GMP-specific phosphodiesterase class I)
MEHEEGAEGVRALRLEQIGVAFQPIVKLSTGKVFGQEALVRCKRPEYADPRALFEHAVAEDACGRLGRMIREVAFTSCGDVPLFVNLHPAELAARWLVRPDDPIGFHSQPVYLEIPESATYSHFDLCTSILKELCVRTGALLAVDDVGASYSSVERLVQLEPAVVKLDITVTRDIDKNPLQQAVARDMVSLCKDLSALVVAEGIENVRELAMLKELGVTLGQGYLLARPAFPPPVPVWLA